LVATGLKIGGKLEGHAATIGAVQFGAMPRLSL
jgi:hypothetical protein